MKRGLRGFTVIELLVVLLIMSILVRLSLPLVSEARRSAQATQIIGALTTLRASSYSYQASTSRWPATASAGTVPPALVNQLPTGFSFVTPQYRLQWVVNQVSLQGAPRQVPSVRAYIGEAELCSRTAGVLGGARNLDVVAMCQGQNGYVSWSFDR